MTPPKRLIIDVREPLEFMFGHVDGAINLPPARLIAGAKQLSGVPKDTELILYCASGSRSAMSINILKQQGFANLVNGVNKDQVKAKYLGSPAS